VVFLKFIRTIEVHQGELRADLQEVRPSLRLRSSGTDSGSEVRHGSDRTTQTELLLLPGPVRIPIYRLLTIGVALLVLHAVAISLVVH
jgi:hypothetical protein